jgi:GNAT superfamily N-acetyltransferase
MPDVFQARAHAAFTPEQIRALFDMPDQRFWLGVLRGGPVGYMYAEVQRRPATTIKLPDFRLYVHQMSVLEAARGQGVGTALLAAARTFAKANQIARLALDVWAFNDRARSFYERHGFSVVRHELWGDVEDAPASDRDPAA